MNLSYRRVLRRTGTCLVLASMVVGVGPALAELDLGNAEVHTLDNGFTIVLLVDRNFPVVSTQMVYRAGARNEVSGKTGLAHFLEHMAFRDSERFPDTGLVSSIYAKGGEWHGYTWLDQTTYFATAPKEQLELLLRIEADRMSRLKLPADKMDAERGAVIAELHLYENSPAAVLLDAVMLSSFVAHPYRNNTIGWQSDIENFSHADVTDFYERHYHAANAVLAVVGDIHRDKVLQLAEDLFAALPARPVTPLPHTEEPPQTGTRRVLIHGEAEAPLFMIGYRAPSVSDADFAAFLVLQEILGTGSGVNFLQNDWGTATEPGDPLHDVAQSVTTWYPPSEQEFLFVIGGSAVIDADLEFTEEGIEHQIATVRDKEMPQAVVAAAKMAVLDALVFDIETTEDAAHQLAFFQGIHALDTLMQLADAVALVRPEDVQRVANRFLQPRQRNIAWYLPSQAGDKSPGRSAPNAGLRTTEQRLAVHPDESPVPPPLHRRLDNGLPVIVQASDLSNTVQLQLVVPGTRLDGDNLLRNEPVDGYSAIEWQMRPDELQKVIAGLREYLDALRPIANGAQAPSADPATRLEEEFARRMKPGAAFGGGDTRAAPALVLVSGAVQTEPTVRQLAAELDDAPIGAVPQAQNSDFQADDEIVRLGRTIRQAQLGYLVPAAAPADDAHDAWRLLLYILSHDYEGRLGKAAISDRGLAYYIDSRYRSNGQNAWVTLSVGVDVGKIEELDTLLRAELDRLTTQPPTLAEIEEAKSYYVGRARSAAQSNAELNDRLARDWLWYGEILTPAALGKRLAAVSRDDVLAIIPAFTAGKTILVRD